MRVALQTFVLLLAASGAAVFANAVRSKPLPWVLDRQTSNDLNVNQELKKQAYLSEEDFLRHVQAPGSVNFVDARNEDEYVAGHVAGAINIPAPKKEEQQHVNDIMTMLSPGQLTIIYCDGGNCEASNTVYEYLLGFPNFTKENVRVFEKGWEFIGKRTDVPIHQGPQP